MKNSVPLVSLSGELLKPEEKGLMLYRVQKYLKSILAVHRTFKK